ncbi:MAG: helix-turn-helix domain-containing protein [Clostridia bacterium]|nr:helix-turn-helix domain-containing protein [Clostridia bacterium]
MDQLKTGKLIAKMRKERALTQAQLAEKLGVTDRAVSKWETGKSLPDASLMLDLCGLLGITVNDLLSGEVVSMENYNEKTEKNLLEMIKQKEKADKRLLKLEVLTGVLSSLFLASMALIAAAMKTMGAETWIAVLLIGVGLAQFIVSATVCLRIEQVAGYYKCENCGSVYVPSFKSVNLAMHMGRTRYMKCPSCGKKSWQKKVISKEE